jgi:hypothetical protein
MRRVIAVAVLVAGVAGLLPGVVGLYLHQRHDRLLDDIAARGYELGQRDYRRGWLRSEAEVQIAPPADAERSPARLRLRLRLHHGYEPWLAAWPPRLAKISGRATVLDGPRPLPPLVLAATLGPAGDMDGTLRVPDVTFSGAAGQLHLVSGRSAFSISPGGRWGLFGGLDALEAKASDGRILRLEGLDWSVSLIDADAALPVARLTLGLSALVLDPTELRPALSLDGLELALRTEMNAGAAALTAKAAVVRLMFGDDGYAPASAELSLAGLRAPAVHALRDRLAALESAALTASQRGAALARTVVAALPTVFADEPQLTLRLLRVATPYGELVAKTALRLLPAHEVTGGGVTAPADSLRVLAARLAGTAELSAPQALVVALITAQQARRVRQELALRGESTAALPPTLAAELDAAAQASAQTLLRRGWLVAEQGRLVARLRLDDGVLTLNGKPVVVANWRASASP